jgi:molecular chaperone GrpE (heat shock protein)
MCRPFTRTSFGGASGPREAIETSQQTTDEWFDAKYVNNLITLVITDFLDCAKKMENYKDQFKKEMERIQKHGTQSVYSL